MLNIRRLSVILRRFWRGRGAQALATALKTTVCLLNGADVPKPSPPSRRSVFLSSFSPIPTVGTSSSRAEPCGSLLSPHHFKPTLLSPQPSPTAAPPSPGAHRLPVPSPPMDEPSQSRSPVGAVGPLVFPICRERDKDHHLPLSPCTANISSPDPRGFLCSPKAAKHGRGRGQKQQEGRNNIRHKEREKTGQGGVSILLENCLLGISGAALHSVVFSPPLPSPHPAPLFSSSSFFFSRDGKIERHELCPKKTNPRRWNR